MRGSIRGSITLVTLSLLTKQYDNYKTETIMTEYKLNKKTFKIAIYEKIAIMEKTQKSEQFIIIPRVPLFGTGP